jgi:hypothetical protein
VREFRGALRDTIPDSPEEEAEYRFMLGETYADELGLRDEAFREFKTVADSLPDTGFGPKAILRTASMLESEGDTLAGLYYSRVIEMVPGSVHANFARSRLGLPLVDVVLQKPVVWEEGRVVGPVPPSAPSDSLPFVGPELPQPEPGRTSPDSTMRNRRSRPDSTGPARPKPEATGIRFPHAVPTEVDSADTSGPRRGGDTLGTHVPGGTDSVDTKGQEPGIDTSDTYAPPDSAGDGERRER